MTNNLIHIPEPCAANWNEMQSAGNCLRHCASCKTNVHDFTKQSLSDIQKTLAENSSMNICGRYHERHTGNSKKVYIIANKLDKAFSKTKLKSFSLVVISLILLFAGCARRRTMGAWAAKENKQPHTTSQTRL